MGKYFTIDELCKSDTAKKKGINNTPTAEIKQKLGVLIDELLDPVREAWGKPIRVNSGYRCAKLNKAVGGVSNSQHIKGEAADLNAGSVPLNKQLFELIRTNYEYDQLINEANYAWVHVSYVRKNRHQVLHLKAK